MCPDRQILSVYFDGELGSPWQEKFEKHLEFCPQCQTVLEGYRICRERLGTGPGATEGKAMEQIWETIRFLPRRRRRSFWTGSISVPIPLTAAAAAALVLVFTLTILAGFRQPRVKPADSQLAGLEVEDMTPVSDMASFFKYLEGGDSPDMVIIRLPATTFKRSGEPQMLRAADYSRTVLPDPSRDTR
ncbi:MAG: zf-HC2 domain-containing protein [Treponema sp.]|jgi:hypothetical protein|nr:zf-HC2 domain-containing protein [Treponema sp.]